MSDLTRLSAAALSHKLAAGEGSSGEATRAHLDRIAAGEAALHPFLHGSYPPLDGPADIARRRAGDAELGRPSAWS